MDTKSAPAYPITNQPASPADMDLYATYHTGSASQCAHGGRCSHRHRLNKRWLLVPALAFLLSLALAACVALASPDSALSALFFGGGEGVGGELLKRAVDDGTGNNNGTFVNHKLYLIVIFVGLFLVVVAGIMLSFWCCRGSFENPLCCPCYLCACCGGLACLECIGCGLCADAIDNA